MSAADHTTRMRYGAWACHGAEAVSVRAETVTQHLVHPNPPTVRRGHALPLLAVVFAVACLMRWPVAAIPLERDEGEYAYIGQRWLLGGVPYRDSFDQKPPGTFMAYALIERLI